MVVGGINGLHILKEAVEGLEAAVLVLQQTRGVIHFVPGLEAGEKEDVLVQGTGHFVGDGALEMPQFLCQNVMGGVHQREGFRLGEHFRGESLLCVEPFRGLFKGF